MRLALVMALLASTGATAAQAVEDRYGPPRAQPVAVPSPVSPGAARPQPIAAPYAGRTLSWGGKAQQPVVPAVHTPVVQPPAAPQPVAPQPVAYTPPSPRTAPAAQAAPLPTSLYDRPAPRAAVQPAPQSRPSPQPAPQPQPEPQRIAATQPGAQSARSYSVVREFGGVPDPINIPPPTSYWATRPGALDPMPGDTAPDAEKPAASVDDAAAPWNPQTARAGGAR